MDLFATRENTFAISLPPAGRCSDIALAGSQAYTFPPVKILPVLCKIREEKASVILVAPNWPNQPWFADLRELLMAPPWRIPLKQDLLSQANGTI